MQTFKEITYQNYIELRFNPKNLHETVQQQALIKYKRNAMLLAQIFAFNRKQKQVFKTESIVTEGTSFVTEEHIRQIEGEIEEEEREGERRVTELEQKTKNYRHLLQTIKQIKTEEEKSNFIKRIREAGLYDERHPYFVQKSPFYLLTTEQEFLEVTEAVEGLNEGELNIFQIN